MVERSAGGGELRTLIMVVGALGCLISMLVVLLVAGGMVFLGWRSMPPELEGPVVVTAPAPAIEAPAERSYAMDVCADERTIRVLAPLGGPLEPSALQVIPGSKVGVVTGGAAPDPVVLARYGWVAADQAGGILRWWQPDDFEGFDQAERAIRQVLGYCEVCCASGTVVEQDSGGRMVWLQDRRFGLLDGSLIGGSFDAVVRGAPAGARVEEDEMDGLPTIDLGGATAYGEADADELTMLVVRLVQP